MPSSLPLSIGSTDTVGAWVSDEGFPFPVEPERRLAVAPSTASGWCPGRSGHCGAVGVKDLDC